MDRRVRRQRQRAVLPGRWRQLVGEYPGLDQRGRHRLVLVGPQPDPRPELHPRDDSHPEQLGRSGAVRPADPGLDRGWLPRRGDHAQGDDGAAYRPGNRLIEKAVAAPLAASGRFIVDANGNRVRLAGVNWYGASEDLGGPAGPRRARTSTWPPTAICAGRRRCRSTTRASGP